MYLVTIGEFTITSEMKSLILSDKLPDVFLGLEVIKESILDRHYPYNPERYKWDVVEVVNEILMEQFVKNEGITFEALPMDPNYRTFVSEADGGYLQDNFIAVQTVGCFELKLKGHSLSIHLDNGYWYFNGSDEKHTTMNIFDLLFK